MFLEVKSFPKGSEQPGTREQLGHMVEHSALCREKSQTSHSKDPPAERDVASPVSSLYGDLWLFVQ